jgi:hypothetical protein
MVSYIVKNILLVVFSTISGLGIGLTVFEIIQNSILPLILGPLTGFALGSGTVCIINAINNSRVNNPVHFIDNQPIQNKDLLEQKIYFSRKLESILNKKVKPSIQFLQVDCVNNINSPSLIIEKEVFSEPIPSPSAPEDPCI